MFLCLNTEKNKSRGHRILGILNWWNVILASYGKIVIAFVAVINFLASGKPSSRFPYISLLTYCLDDCHPPIKETEKCKTNYPFDEYPNHIKNTQ